MNILSFGEIIWDVYPDKKCLGGAPLNFAAHCVKSGAKATLLSCIGGDELGKEALDQISSYKVSSELVSVHSSLGTGRCDVTLDSGGVPTYTIASPVAWDEIRTCKSALPAEFDLLAFGSLALKSATNRTTLSELIKKGRFKTVYCDLNLRAPFYDEDTVLFCLSLARILKLSESELEYVSKILAIDPASDVKDTLCLLCQKAELDTIILTMGEQGAYAYEKSSDQLCFAPAQKVKVISTVGAGDSFGAVFAVNYLQGKDISQCLEMATERSAYVVAHKEAIPK